MNGKHHPHWDPSLEKVTAREDVQWLLNDSVPDLCYDKMVTWILLGPPPVDLNVETALVDRQVLEKLLETKNLLFSEFNQDELRKARSRANVFETLRNAFFMNRAALKIANIDAITGWMFTKLDYDPIHRRTDGPYYFADVCAGPGGFTEYILWRKKWCYKGFGFTLKGEHDFKLYDSSCASAETFRSYYGSEGDGNIFNPNNIYAFRDVIRENTQGDGVHFMMSDGGFSVEGNEKMQEILSKELYICQCLMALEILRPQGYFVTKMFDLFTPFSVGLVFLMHMCFDKIAIVKPNASRPANAERYLICKGLKATTQTQNIRKYLRKVVEDLWMQKQTAKTTDIIGLVPAAILNSSSNFLPFLLESNTSIAKRQIIGLSKLRVFCKDTNLIEPRQDAYRSECLNLWQIPDKKRPGSSPFTIDNIINMIHRPEFMLTQPREIHDMSKLATIIDDVEEWAFVPLSTEEYVTSCNIYVGTSTLKTLRLVENRWVRKKQIHLGRGTLLYGELVQETGSKKLSLHVIDALMLEDTSLADLPFDERAACLKIFCQAIDFESDPVRIRHKAARPLSVLSTERFIHYNDETSEYFTNLNGNIEYPVKSMLFLKTAAYQIFTSTYVLRAWVGINGTRLNGTTNSLTMGKLVGYLKSFNKKL